MYDAIMWVVATAWIVGLLMGFMIALTGVLAGRR